MIIFVDFDGTLHKEHHSKFDRMHRLRLGDVGGIWQPRVDRPTPKIRALVGPNERKPVINGKYRIVQRNHKNGPPARTYVVQRRWFGLFWLRLMVDTPYRHPALVFGGACGLIQHAIWRRAMVIKAKRRRIRQPITIIHNFGPASVKRVPDQPTSS